MENFRKKKKYIYWGDLWCTGKFISREWLQNTHNTQQQKVTVMSSADEIPAKTAVVLPATEQGIRNRLIEEKRQASYVLSTKGRPQGSKA